MHLKNGWTWDADIGAVCHFRHHPLADAERRAQTREKCSVVETVNWTYGEGDRKTCHLNAYFAIDMPSAIALTVRMEIEFKEVSEDVIRIRPATDSETAVFFSVQDHLEAQLPPPLSARKASALARQARQPLSRRNRA